MRKPGRERDMEDEANLFARCLLMPEAMLRTEVKAELARRDTTPDLLDDNETFVRDLARRFGVPETAMAMRLMELEIIKL